MAKLYSHSRLASFENCKKQFHFRYVLEVPTDTEGIEAFVGKRVHEVLERLYLFADRGQVPAHDKVIARYHQLFDQYYDAERVKIVREENDVAFYRELGVRCLSHYYRTHYPFDDGETLGVEQRVTFAIDDAGAYKMQGIIDRVVRTPDGVIEIHDYKTGRWVPSQKKLDEDRQLALYQIGLQREFGDTPMRLVWHYLQKRQKRVSTRTPEDLAKLRTDTVALIDRIHAEREFAPKKIALCDWCDYRQYCPAFPDPKPTPLRVRKKSSEPPDPNQMSLL